MLFSVALAVVVAVVVSLSRPGEESAEQDASPEPLAAGVGEEKKDAFEPGQRLEIDEEEPRKEEEAKAEPAPLPLVAQEDWPEPSGEEVAATNTPRYYPPRRDSALSLTVEAWASMRYPS